MLGGHNPDLSRDSAPQLAQVAHQSDASAARSQRVDLVQDLVEGVGIQTAEALVDEERAQFGAADLVAHEIGEPERQGQADIEGLATGQRGRVALLARVRVEHPQPEPASGVADPFEHRVQQLIAPRRDARGDGRWRRRRLAGGAQPARSARAWCGSGCRATCRHTSRRPRRLDLRAARRGSQRSTPGAVRRPVRSAARVDGCSAR